MEELNVGTFTKSLLLHVARERGDLEDAGLSINEVSVASSPAQFEALERGDLDLVFTSPDNAISYRFLDANPLGRRLDVRILAGVDRGTGLTLCLAPGRTLDDVRGGVVGVDVPTSGFAFVAFELLARAGLARTDYETVALGATPKRADALLAGACDATILNAGNELRALGAGATLVDTVASLGPYLGTVLATLSSNDQSPSPATNRLVDVLIALVNEVLAGDRDDALARAAVAVLNLTPAQAEAHVGVLRSRAHGLVADGVVDRAALATLVALRDAALPDPTLATLSTRWDELVDANRLSTTPN